MVVKGDAGVLGRIKNDQLWGMVPFFSATWVSEDQGEKWIKSLNTLISSGFLSFGTAPALLESYKRCLGTANTTYQFEH